MSTLEIHQSFERYRITRWLGSSISGESYEAQDAMLHRKVTLKLIHPTSTLPDAARRQFFRQMQGVSILNHLYLAQVLDYGEFDSKLYVARCFVENGSLLSQYGRLWYSAPLRIPDAVHYGIQIAQALQYIHNRGLTHGSLTLSNILVLHNVSNNSRENAPFLLSDVGLTHLVRSSNENNAVPLPFSAAPEQHHNRTIPASDQFALAALLYLWLTGRPPFIGSPQEIEKLKFAQSITPPSMINANISLEQDRIILHALSATPEDRYPSMQTFADVLLSTITPNSQPAFSPEIIHHNSSTVHDTSEQTQQLSVDKIVEDHSHSISETEILSIPSGPSSLTAHLIIFSTHSDEPHIVELLNNEITIGRAGSSDILLEDDLTSRHHALLKRDGEHYAIFDRRSANGIQINGLPIQSDKGYPLIDGDYIKIGNYEMTFRAVVLTSIDQDHQSLASKA